MTGPLISFRFDPAMGRLTHGIAGHLADLRHALAALESGAFPAEVQTSPATFFRVEYRGVDPRLDAERRHAYKAFVGIVGCFVGFLDELVAMKRLMGTTIPVTRTLSGEDEIKAYVEAHLRDVTSQVSADHGLRNADKIGMFDVSEEAATASRGYFRIRNAIEHQRGIPPRDVEFVLSQLQVETNDGVVIDRPMIVEGGQSIQLRIRTERRVLRAGEVIQLTEDDIQVLVRSIDLVAREVVGTMTSSDVVDRECRQLEGDDTWTDDPDEGGVDG